MTGAGPPQLFMPDRLSFDLDGDILVTDQGETSIIEVDPATGNRTFLISQTLNETGDGVFILSRLGVGFAVDVNGDLIIPDQPGQPQPQRKRRRTGEAATSRHLCIKMFRLVNVS